MADGVPTAMTSWADQVDLEHPDPSRILVAGDAPRTPPGHGTDGMTSEGVSSDAADSRGGRRGGRQRRGAARSGYSSAPAPLPSSGAVPVGGGAQRRSGQWQRGSGSDSAPTSRRGLVPWLSKARGSFNQNMSLATEMEDFRAFVSLSPAERAARDDCIAQLSAAAPATWAGCDVLPYGSYAVDLSMSTSDLDVAVDSCGHGFGAQVPAFSAALAAAGFDIVGTMANAGDAFVKLRGPARAGGGTRVVVNVSLTAGRSPVREGLTLLRRELAQYPQAPCVIVVLRTVLAQCQLADVAAGGISSYCVLLLALRFCQRYHATRGASANAGVLLRALLSHYADEFNYEAETAAVTAPSAAGQPAPLRRLHPGAPLSIADPLDPNNNVAAGFVKLARLRAMLRYCSLALGRWDEPAASSKSQATNPTFRGRTPLSTIIAAKGVIGKRR